MAPDWADDVERAIHLLELGRPAQALEACGRHLASFPDHGKALLVASVAHRHLGRVGPAVDFAARAVAVLPNDDVTYGFAERALTEAARLSPTDPRVHFEMAHLRFLGAKEGEALDSVASALAADPTGIGAQSLAMARRQLLRVVFLHACVSVIGCFASGAILGPRPATGNRIALAALALVMGGGMILPWAACSSGQTSDGSCGASCESRGECGRRKS
ncbi:MAG: tetratricopeptide repeat protein [Dermatophilaceae bacterium]